MFVIKTQAKNLKRKTNLQQYEIVRYYLLKCSKIETFLITY